MTRKRVKEDRSFFSRFQPKIDPSRQREIAGLALFAFGGLILLSLLHITPGIVSERAASFLRALVGWGAFAVPLSIFGVSALLLRRGHRTSPTVTWGRVFSSEVFVVAVLALIHLVIPSENGAALANQGDGGGFVGWVVSSALTSVIGSLGASLSLSAAALFTLPVVLGLSATHIHQWSESVAARAAAAEVDAKPAKVIGSHPAGKKARKPKPAPVPKTVAEQMEAEPEPLPEFEEEAPLSAPERVLAPATPLPASTIAHPVLTNPRRARRRPVMPSLDLFATASEARYGEADASRKAHLIEETLANFGIPVKVIEVNAGPTVTQFGLEPGFVMRRTTDGQMRQRKVSVGRISALQHDLELALAAAPIRIETPVPGRPIVGIEVPNQSISLVSLRGVLESDPMKKKRGPLRIALGRDVSGMPIAADLSGMPHLLIAGATGSGKSVCINAIVACLLYNNSPDSLRLIMVDPKRVELTSFNSIPHLLGPVIVNVDEVRAALQWVVDEMDSRFKLFAEAHVRNIEGFNERAIKTEGSPTLPYIVVLIDELADLMLAAPEETEKLLTRLAQMARATGIHLIIATQRPSVNVVTGLIKANFPSRISFAVTSSVDSRVVLDTPGAEKLIGRGDMLYMASDSSKLLRMQGCFVSDEELGRLVHFWRERAITEMRDIVEEPPWKELGNGSKNGGDDLIEKATQLARQSSTTSISFMQRKLGIGYPRAARLMDQLQELGIVGPDEGGGKPRAVLPAQQPVEAERLKKKK